MSDLQKYLDLSLSKVKLANIDEPIATEEYDIYEEIRHIILDIRNAKEITQNQLAIRSGVSQSNISKIENGSHRPSLATLKKIADALGRRLVVDFEDLEGLE